MCVPHFYCARSLRHCTKKIISSSNWGQSQSCQSYKPYMYVVIQHRNIHIYIFISYSSVDCIVGVDWNRLEVFFGFLSLVARKYIFGLIWRRYGQKWDILAYRGKIIFCLLSYYILSKDSYLKGLKQWIWDDPIGTMVSLGSFSYP